MNFPRYVNPHSVAQATQPTSRAELYIESSQAEEDDSLKAHLESLLLKRGLQPRDDEETTHRKRKRQKVVVENESVGDLFRVVGS
jgi:hypothetical protein